MYSRKGAELEERSKLNLEGSEERLQRNLEDEKRILNDERTKRLATLLVRRGEIPEADLKMTEDQ